MCMFAGKAGKHTHLQFQATRLSNIMPPTNRVNWEFASLIGVLA